MKTFHLTIASLDKNVFSGFVKSVTVPGSEGEMTVLAGHTPLISRLAQGSVRCVTDTDTTHTFDITHGILEVTSAGVTILA